MAVNEFGVTVGVVTIGDLFQTMGRIPKRAEKFHYGEWEFEVVDMDHNRVDDVLATRTFTQ